MSVEAGRQADPVAGILLAAGTSSRMGSNKLLFELQGETLLRRSARQALAGGPSPLLVVLGNAPAVTLQFNGAPVTASTLVRRDGSAHMLIDAAGRVGAAAPRLAHGD